MINSSIHFVYSKENVYKNLPVYDYVLPDNIFSNSTKICDQDLCTNNQIDGLLNAKSCYSGF